MQLHLCQELIFFSVCFTVIQLIQKQNVWEYCLYVFASTENNIKLALREKVCETAGCSNSLNIVFRNRVRYEQGPAPRDLLICNTIRVPALCGGKETQSTCIFALFSSRMYSQKFRKQVHYCSRSIIYSDNLLSTYERRERLLNKCPHIGRFTQYISAAQKHNTRT
jgi:hypothetical protein